MLHDPALGFIAISRKRWIALVELSSNLPLKALLCELFVLPPLHGAIRRRLHRDVALRLLRQVRSRPRRPLVLLRLHG